MILWKLSQSNIHCLYSYHNKSRLADCESLEPVPGQDFAGGATCSSVRPTGWNLSQLESDSRPGRITSSEGVMG